MKKKQLAELVAERMNVPTAQAVRFVDALFGVLRQEQMPGDGVAVEGLGTFRCRDRSPGIRTAPVSDDPDRASLPKISGRTAVSSRGAKIELTRVPAVPASIMEAQGRRSGRDAPVPAVVRGLEHGQLGASRAAGLRDMVDGLRASARGERANSKRRV